MKETVLSTTHQAVIVARLFEFYDWGQAAQRHVEDPWEFMRGKLLQIEEPLGRLKAELFAMVSRQLMAELQQGAVDDERYADYRVLYERLLRPGDYADLAIHLDIRAGPGALGLIRDLLRRVKPTHLFEEERLPAAERNSSWERLVAQLSERLQLNLLGKLFARKPVTPKRRALVLWRIRRNVREYCSVMRIPTTPQEVFTPFMLPRVEALVASNLRFLNKFR